MRYVTDPSSARAQGGIVLPGSVFDTRRIREALKRKMIEGIPPMEDPSDEKLIACVMAHGMPRWAADQMRYNPSLRLQYYLFHEDVRDAAKGVADAKERVDAAIDAWAQMRKAEVIHDNPNMSVGFWER